MSSLKRFVVEITMVIDDEGTEETFLFSTSPFATKPTDVPPNTPVYGYLDNPGTFKQELFSGARVTGAITPSFGGITLTNHAPEDGEAGVLDHWVNYGVSGGRVVVRWGEEGADYPSEFTTVYIGYARTPRIGADKVVVPLTDGSRVLDAPVVTEGFDGSGGLEGFGAVAKPKQFVSGDPGFIVPILVDSIRQIYFVQSTGTYAHDSWVSQPTVDVNAFDVFELGQKIDRVSPNYSSAAEVVSTQPSPGTVRYWFGPDSAYVNGWKSGPVYFRLGTPPIGDLRVYPIGTPTDADHARAGGATGSFSFATMALRAGVTLDRIADAYAAIGAILVDDATTYSDVMSKCCRASQAWFGFTRLDEFRSGYLLDPNDNGYYYGVSTAVLPASSNPAQPTTSLYTFTQDRYESLRREPVAGMEAPVWSLFVKARKTWPCPVSEDAPDTLKDYLTRDPWWATFQGVSDTCKVANPGAIVETLEVENADFPNAFSRRLFLERYFALFGGRRDCFILTAPMSDALLALELHDVVTLQTPRFGLSAGRKFRIVSIDIDCRKEVPMITFSLWGGNLGQFTGTVSLVSNVGAPQQPQITSGRRVFPAFRREGVGTASGAATPSGSVRAFPAFTRPAMGTAVTLLWTEDDRIQASNAGAGDSFGTAVAINSDGTYIGITAPNEDTTATNAGLAYIFNRSGTWSEQDTAQPSDVTTSDQFGGSSLLGSTGHGYNFIGISDAGDRVIVSMPNDNSLVGAAYVFKRTGSTWAEEQKLVGSDSVANDYFGYSVAMNAAGDVVAVSAPRDANSLGVQAGSVYIFTRSGTTWTEQTRIQLTSGGGAVQSIGVALALNEAGDTLAIGCGGGVSLKVVIFTESAGTWTQQQSLSAPSGGAFGAAVALDSPGDTLVVGAPDQTTAQGAGRGAAHVYTRSGGTWSHALELTDTTGANNDDFGTSVAIDGAGNTIIVGSPFNDDIAGNAGAAFVFRGYGSWSLDLQISGSDTAAADLFGNSVALSRDGTWAAIGAFGDANSGGSAAGSVYTFTLS
jgi:hypothetical protein